MDAKMLDRTEEKGLYKVECLVHKEDLETIKNLSVWFSRFPRDTDDLIRKLLDEEKWDEAETELNKAKNEFGQSTFTVTLDTLLFFMRVPCPGVEEKPE
jgi:hypothetical protein